MALFRDLSFVHLLSRRVYIDLDGTLVPDGEDRLAPAEAHKLQELVDGRDVFIVTNRGIVRARDVGDEHGVAVISSNHKKPNPRVIAHLPPHTTGEVVIGDLALSDGFFAWRIGARFIKVDHLRARTDALSVRMIYAVDAMVWMLSRALWRIQMSTAFAYIELMRPKQWLKNLLLFAPIFFSGLLLSPGAALDVVYALVAFSLAASVGYSVNDAFDCAEDQAHPTKCTRPIASGRISIRSAATFALMVGVLAVYVASFVPQVIPWIAFYLVASYLYTSRFKQIPVIEFIFVAAFYDVRMLAGAAAIGVLASPVQLILVFCGALLITVGKRCIELRHNSGRAVGRKYAPDFVRAAPAIVASITLALYAMVTLLPTARPGALYSSIFVFAGVFWYLMRVYADDVRQRPDSLFMSLTVNGALILLWGMVWFVIIYSPAVLA